MYPPWGLPLTHAWWLHFLLYGHHIISLESICFHSNGILSSLVYRLVLLPRNTTVSVSSMILVQRFCQLLSTSMMGSTIRLSPVWQLIQIAQYEISHRIFHLFSYHGWWFAGWYLYLLWWIAPVSIAFLLPWPLVISHGLREVHS